MEVGVTKQDDPEKDPEIDPGKEKERIAVVAEETSQEFHPP
jgi:hypothetical protein